MAGWGEEKKLKKTIANNRRFNGFFWFFPISMSKFDISIAVLFAFPWVPIYATDVLFHPPDLLDIAAPLMPGFPKSMSFSREFDVTDRSFANFFHRIAEHQGLIIGAHHVFLAVDKECGSCHVVDIPER